MPRRPSGRRPVHALLATAVCTALVLVSCGAAEATVPPPDRWPEGRPGTFLIHHDGSGFDVNLEGDRRRVFLLNSWEWPMIEAIKAENPDALVFMYKDLSSTRSYPQGYDGGGDAEGLPSGVDYAWADANHPEWFLTGRDGQRLEWEPYPDHWFMDVGHPNYQERWLWNVFVELSGRGWDGVFLDNALTRATAYGPAPARYPTDADMQAATRSMLGVVGPRLHAVGFLTVANISDSRLFPGLWEDWLQVVDGALEEYFVNWNPSRGGPYLWDWGPDGWRAQVEQVASAARLDKMALVRIGGDPGDADAARYGLASYLLANGGRSMVSHTDRAWIPEMGWDLGSAVDDYEQVGAHVYQRRFTKGIVVVNAAETGSATVRLGGTYVDAWGTRRSDLSLPAQRGAILRTP